jgi:hypothetical protein
VSELRPRRSRVWSAVFRASYRMIRLLDPLIRSWVANGYPGLDGVIEIRTLGRRSGRERRSMVTLLVVDGEGFIGHPNGEASWIANALASGWIGVVGVDGGGQAATRSTVTRLDDGPVRDAVIRATWSQQPFPGNLLYRAARRHVAAVGVYLRLGPPEAV